MRGGNGQFFNGIGDGKELINGIFVFCRYQKQDTLSLLAEPVSFICKFLNEVGKVVEKEKKSQPPIPQRLRKR